MHEKPEFYGSTVVSDKGQVVIPVEARTELGFEKGEKLLVMGMGKSGLMLVKASSLKIISEKLAERQQEISKLLEKDI